MSFLTSLPQELLCEISSYLSAEHIFSLRLACRAIERALLEQFARRFFKKKQFLVPNRYSLQKFLDISEHPVLSEALQHVILAVDRSLFPERSAIIHRTHMSNPYSWWNSPLYSRLREGSDGGFTAPGEERQLLFRSFGNSPNIRTIQLWDSEDQGYSFRTEILTSDRDDFSFYRPQDLDRCLDHMLVNTLQALAAANARLEALETVVDSFGCCLHDLAFNIPGPLQPSMAATLSGLKQLTLAVSLRSESADSTTDLGNEFCLQRFLTLTPNLVSLQLRFYKWENYMEAWNFLDWLGRQADSNLPGPPAEMTRSPDQPDAVQFSQLEHLRLDTFMVSPSIVMKLVTKFSPSLRRLHLDNVYLVELHNDPEDRVNIWTTLLKDIAAKSELNEWTIGMLGVSNRRAGRRPTTTYGEFSNGQNMSSYRGDDAKAALKAAADDVTLFWDLEEEDSEEEAESEDTDASGDVFEQHVPGVEEDT